MPRRIFIGDIQGCIDELRDLLERLDFDRDHDKLFCVGDLVNRGPGSLETLRLLRELGADSVLGNHDLHLLAIAKGEREPRPEDTLDELLAAPDCDDLLDWLRSRPLILEWDDVIAIHAGISPAWASLREVAAPLETAIASGSLPFSSDDLAFLTRVRRCTPEGKMDEKSGKPWNEFYHGQRFVVCGHWAERGVTIDRRMRAIDGGCVWGGTLNAWIAEEDHLVTVSARRPYCML